MNNTTTIRNQFLEKVMQVKGKTNSRLNILALDDCSALVAEIKEATLLNPKSPLQHRRLKRFAVMKIGDVEKLVTRSKDELQTSEDDENDHDINPHIELQIQDVRYVVPVEDMFDILDTYHKNTGHGDRDRMKNDISRKYSNITQEIISIYISLCQACHLKRSKKRKGLTVKPILHSEFNSRAQINLIDVQSEPDGEFKFILVYQDHLTKFVNLRALKTKTTDEVAQYVRDILYYIVVILALFVVPFLPVSKDNIYWTKPEKTEVSPATTNQLLYKNFVESFSDKYVIKWSLWTAFSLSGYWHATMYIQPLWKLSQDVDELPVHNGVVEGISAFIAVPGSILMGLGQLDWKFKGDLILTMVSLLQGFFLIFAAWMDHVFLQYMFYVYFVVIYQGILTALWAELAQKLKKGCYGLVFGFAFFVGSILSCVLTVLLVFSFEFDYYDQFLLYGIYHIAISLLYIVFGLISWYKKNTYEI